MNQITYQPGTHSLIDLEQVSPFLLQDADKLIELWNDLIRSCGLHKIGEIVHKFPEKGGFTAVICLTESHMSIHTWPEYGTLTFDIFLSNYEHVNDGHCKHIVDSTCTYFEGVCTKQMTVRR